MAVLRTIKSTREIDALFQAGTRAANDRIVVLVGETPTGRGPQGRVAFIAGRKTGSAVRRNRTKRVLRASIRRLGVEWPGYDVALIARANTADTPWRELDASIRRALSKAGIIHA